MDPHPQMVLGEAHSSRMTVQGVEPHHPMPTMHITRTADSDVANVTWQTQQCQEVEIRQLQVRLHTEAHYLGACSPDKPTIKPWTIQLVSRTTTIMPQTVASDQADLMALDLGG